MKTKNNFKGLAFDEGINATIFFAVIVLLGILFYVAEIDPISIFGYGGNFISSIGHSLWVSLTTGIN